MAAVAHRAVEMTIVVPDTGRVAGQESGAASAVQVGYLRSFPLLILY
jgi:hypothetical protein